MSSRVKTQLGNLSSGLRPCSSKTSPSSRVNSQFRNRSSSGLRLYSSKTSPIDSIKEIGLRDVYKLLYEDLASYTDNFSESNFLSHFQFGKLYRGKIVQDKSTLYVTVKIWEVNKKKYYFRPGDNEGRLVDEVMILRHKMHPAIVKLYGFCNDDDHLGVVYELDPLDSVFNLIPKDNFTWLQRIKVALEFASLLKFLHTPKCSFYKPYIVRNLDCAHIVVDKDYNPKLCDFGLITGGIFPDRTTYKFHHVHGSYGYIDPGSFCKGVFSDKQDVFAFGVILLNLISKRAYDPEKRDYIDVYEWAWTKFHKFEELCDETSQSEWKNLKFSLFHQSLTAEPDFEAADEEKISELVIECTGSEPSKRPTMKQVVRRLLKLKFVKKHAHVLGVSKVVRNSQ